MITDFKSIICPHRGLGKENSLVAIKSAIDTNPFMVEFDIQNVNGTFYLGHPPKINYKSTLIDAVEIFKNTNVLPKVDIKCNTNWRSDIDLLINQLENYNTDFLINIGGDNLSSRQFMNAELYLLQETKSVFLLNIDIARYYNNERNIINNHISSLPRKPFSVSPMLEGDYEKEI